MPEIPEAAVKTLVEHIPQLNFLAYEDGQREEAFATAEEALEAVLPHIRQMISQEVAK